MQLLVNKKARFEYKIENTMSAGVVLRGGEVKSLRLKSGSLTGSYVKIIGGELFLIGAQITPYKFSDNTDYDPKRTRKLLLKKKEVEQLTIDLEQKKLTLIPLQFETAGRNIKLVFGIGKGLKQFEKRAKIKERDQKRDLQRDLKWG
jgi:SsrA-binding protein